MGTQVHVWFWKSSMRTTRRVVTCLCPQRVWDGLDLWHSRLAALEVELQDVERPEETLVLTERLVEVQQLHSLVSKQAEQRTTLLSKVLQTVTSLT